MSKKSIKLQAIEAMEDRKTSKWVIRATVECSNAKTLTVEAENPAKMDAEFALRTGIDLLREKAGNNSDYSFDNSAVEVTQEEVL